MTGKVTANLSREEPTAGVSDLGKKEKDRGYKWEEEITGKRVHRVLKDVRRNEMVGWT